MIRKMILTVALVTGTIAGAIATATNAEAAPPNHFDRDRHNVWFEVQVRHRGHWETYGTYRDRDDAQRAARQQEHKGRDVRIEIERGRR